MQQSSSPESASHRPGTPAKSPSTEPSFSYAKIAVIGSGFFAITLVWTFYNAFMPLILGEYIESRAMRGAIMGLDNVLAVLLIPWIGTWSDRLQGGLGKRLPFIIVGMPLAAIFLILIPYSALFSLWLLLFVDVLFLLAMTVYRAPVISLMPDHTPSDKRSQASGVINLMGGIGAIIALFALSRLYDLHVPYPFWAAGLLLILSFLLVVKVVDRRPPYVEHAPEKSDEQHALGSFVHGLQRMRQPKYRGHLFVLSAIFFYFIGYSGIEAQFTVYAVEHVGMEPGTAGMTLGFFSLSFVLFAIPAGLLGGKLGKGATMLFGLVLLPCVLLVIPLTTSQLMLQMLLFAGGIAWALINVQAYPLISDLGGTNKIGFFTGLYYLFSMASSIVAPGLLGLVMDLFTPPALFVGGAVSFFIAFYLLWKGQKILTLSTTVFSL